MQKIDKKILDTIKNNVQVICDIQEDNVEDRIKDISKVQHSIFIRFAYEANELNTIETKMKELYGTLYRHYKFNDNHSWETKGEIESQIYADQKYQTLLIECNKQKYIVKELEGCLDNIKTVSFQIKNLIALLKYKAGMY